MKTSGEKISLSSSRFMLFIFSSLVFLVIIICTLMALGFFIKRNGGTHCHKNIYNLKS